MVPAFVRGEFGSEAIWTLVPEIEGGATRFSTGAVATESGRVNIQAAQCLKPHRDTS